MCSLLGIWAYSRFVTSWAYRYIFTVGNLVYFGAALLDVVFFLRWHRPYVDDHYFAVGTAAFESLIEAWLYLPAMILLSQMCPAGLEAVMVAILAGAAHLGAVLSRNFGAALLEVFDVHPVGAPEEGH